MIRVEHECQLPMYCKSGILGCAIKTCWLWGDEIWVGNSEYSNTVNFCPFCGKSVEDLKGEKNEIE